MPARFKQRLLPKSGAPIFHWPFDPYTLLTAPYIVHQYPRIICTKFKQNWCRNKEISMFQTKTLTKVSHTYNQPTNRTTRQPDLLTPTWPLTSPSSAPYMCKYPRIICTKFKQNWYRNKEISMFQTKTLTKVSHTYNQPTGQPDRQKKWSHSLSQNVVQARQKLLESILPNQIKWSWYHSFQKTVFYLMIILSKYAIFSNNNVTKIERSVFGGHPVYKVNIFTDAVFLEYDNINIVPLSWKTNRPICGRSIM